MVGIGFTTSPLASKKIDHLNGSDLKVLDAGVGCWLQNSKSEQFIADDMNKAVIKLEAKVITLQRVSGYWDAGFYDCGKQCVYSSADKKVSATVTMKPGKNDECFGQLSVKGTPRDFVQSLLTSEFAD